MPVIIKFNKHILVVITKGLLLYRRCEMDDERNHKEMISPNDAAFFYSRLPKIQLANW